MSIAARHIQCLKALQRSGNVVLSGDTPEPVGVKVPQTRWTRKPSQ